MAGSHFSSDEFAARLAAVQAAMIGRELDWMVLFHPVSILWLTGSEAKSYQAFQCLIVSAERSSVAMVVRESERAEIEADALVDKLFTWGGSEPGDPLETFEHAVSQLGLARGRVGIEVPAYYLHPHHYLGVRDVLGDALMAEPSELVHDLKLVKSPQEIVYIRRAASIADMAMDAFISALERGTSELRAAGRVYAALLSAGSGVAASTLNLVSGDRAAFSHGAPTERLFEDGDFGNIEYGAAFRKYTATIGRQFVFGDPTRRQRDLFDVVVEAMDACVAEMRPGVATTRPHEAAKRVIATAGLDRYRIHTTGYGLAPGFPPSWGEPVNMFGGNRYILQAGMVLSVEPPIFIPEEKIGVRLIDNVLITEDGAEILTRAPRDLIVA